MKAQLRTVFVTEVLRPSGGASPKRVKLYQVKDKHTGETLFGPSDWKACMAFRRAFKGGSF